MNADIMNNYFIDITKNLGLKRKNLIHISQPLESIIYDLMIALKE